MRRVLPLLLAAVSGCVAGNAPSRMPDAAPASPVYYVDSTDGNDSNRGTTPETAWQHAPGMSACSRTCADTSLRPGSTVYFDRDDTWIVTGAPQGFDLTGGVDYVGDAWEADSGSTGTRAIIRAGNDFNENGVIRFRDHPTVPTVFRGFEVDVNGMAANGIDINHGFASLMNGATKRVENVEIHHVFTEQSRGEFKYGIAMSNWAGENGILENVEILNCSVHDIARDAIVLYPNDNPSSRIGKILVRGCEIYNTGQDPDYGEGTGIGVKGWVYDSVLEYNYVHDVNSSSVSFSGPENEGDQRGPSNIHLRYNILTSPRDDGIVRLFRTGSKDVKIYGNLIFDNETGGGLSLKDNSGTLDLRVYNNTFYNTFVDLGGHSSLVRVLEFANNVVQYPAGQLRDPASATDRSANLLTATDPGFADPDRRPSGFVGTHGVDIRPNTDGFMPAPGSRLVDRGTPLPSDYGDSINSIIRPEGAAWDIGAYEHPCTGQSASC